MGKIEGQRGDRRAGGLLVPVSITTDLLRFLKGRKIMKKEKKENDIPAVPFRKTLPGILTCTAALLIAVAVLIKLLLPHLSEDKATAARSEAGNPSATTCWSVDAEIPKVIPLSLKNSIKAKDYLYWLKVNIDNNCGYPLHLKVSFDFKQKGKDRIIDFDPDLNILDFPVRPRSHFTRKFEPVFTFRKNDLEADLPVSWRLDDDKNNSLAAGGNNIRILPEDRIKWDLAMPDKPVPFNFLLASTAAWTIEPAPEVRDLARQIFQSIDYKIRNGEISVFASTWVAQCYQRFFRGDHIVIPDGEVWNRFPPDSEEVIRRPSEVINGGHFDPVETALCWSTLTNATGVLDRIKCVLVSGKFSKNADKGRDFLFAWRANTSDAKWSAVDIRRGPALSFEENRDRATALLRRISSDNPTLEKDLLRKGIFLGGKEDVVAIDFDRAASIYHIEALP